MLNIKQTHRLSPSHHTLVLYQEKMNKAPSYTVDEMHHTIHQWLGAAPLIISIWNYNPVPSACAELVVSRCILRCSKLFNTFQNCCRGRSFWIWAKYKLEGHSVERIPCPPQIFDVLIQLCNNTFVMLYYKYIIKTRNVCLYIYIEVDPHEQIIFQVILLTDKQTAENKNRKWCNMGPRLDCSDQVTC